MRRVFVGFGIKRALTVAACGSQVENKDEFMDQANQTALTAYVWHLERVSQPKAGQAAAAANQSSVDEGQSLPAAPAEKIGRASCRERVWRAEDGGAVKRKSENDG